MQKGNNMTEIIIYLVTLILSGAAFVAGLSTNFFSLVPTGQPAQLASALVSILIIVLGDRFAASQKQKQFHQNLISLTMRLPNVDLIKEFTDSNEALLYITNRLPEAMTVLNTKISRVPIEPRPDIKRRYVAAIKKGLRKDLVYKDVISSCFQPYSKDLAVYSEDHPGRYQYEILDVGAPCFLNFTILDYGDEKDLVVGWAVSAKIGVEQRAYKIRDNRIIEYFTQYHTNLYFTASSD